MKHSPSKRTKRESVKNKLSMVPGISDIKADSTEGKETKMFLFVKTKILKVVFPDTF